MLLGRVKTTEQDKEDEVIILQVLELKVPPSSAKKLTLLFVGNVITFFVVCITASIVEVSPILLIVVGIPVIKITESAICAKL